MTLGAKALVIGRSQYKCKHIVKIYSFLRQHISQVAAVLVQLVRAFASHAESSILIVTNLSR